MNKPTKKTIFSGVQPSGNLHIGNYIGAISQWVKLQAEYDCIFCVVDYHAITVKQDPKELKKRIIEIAKLYLASGIDPKKSIIFQQSDIKEHTELAWVLNCLTRNSDLTKMTQFKDKTGVNFDKVEAMSNVILNKDKFDEIKKSILNENFKLELENTLITELSNDSNFINKISKDKLIKGIKEIINLKYEKYKENICKNLNEKIYKVVLEKFQEQKELFNKVGIGLFDYPVLMAADILLYNTDIVPVGEDQKQHVELCRDLAKRFNHDFGQTFKIPEAKVLDAGARIMGLDNPEKKMSKSAPSEANYIALLDKPDVAAKKIMRAVTDSGKEVVYDKVNKPAIANLLTIYSILGDIEIKDLQKKYASSGYGEFKKDLAEVVKQFLTGFQNKFNNLTDSEIRKILDQGAAKLQPVASQTVSRAKAKIGIDK